jgi:hypothetical protein
MKYSYIIDSNEVLIMTNKFQIIILGLILFSCVENDEFHEYLKNNNINILYSIEESKYIGIDLETFDLSNEQKNNLRRFLTLFQSSNQYIKDINYENLKKNDLRKIDLIRMDVIGFNNKVEYGIYAVIYSKDKMVDYSTFDEKENLWRTFNIAIYQIIDDKLEFKGFCF